MVITGKRTFTGGLSWKAVLLPIIGDEGGDFKNQQHNFKIQIQFIYRYSASSNFLNPQMLTIHWLAWFFVSP